MSRRQAPLPKVFRRDAAPASVQERASDAALSRSARRMAVRMRASHRVFSDSAPVRLGLHALRLALYGVALSPILWHLATGRLTLIELGGTLLTALLVYLALLNPIASAREHALQFTAPIVFASLLWLGGFPALSGALLGCFLAARSGRKTKAMRNDLRFYGARLATSALCALLLMTWAAGETTALAGVPFQLNALPEGLSAQKLLAVVACGALGFTLCSAGLAFLADAGMWRLRWFSAEGQQQIERRALAYAMGMTPIVLLAPLGATWGMLVSFPAFILLLLSAAVTQLGLEVKSLRRQLQVAEEMGNASVAQPEELDGQVLLQRFLKLSQELVTAERARVWMMNQTTGQLTLAASLEEDGLFADETVAFGEGLIGQGAARMRPLRIADAARDPRRGRREMASGAWLLYPIIVHERVLGVAQWTRPVSHPFSKEDVSRLDALVPQAAVALENVRIRAAMDKQAATDGLTGLWNHRRMQELLRNEMRRSSRYHRALSILMMDVDSFKTFNDNYGHPMGDELLRKVAVILSTNVRTVDFVGRYGGEEFVIILPETSKDAACQLAERIRNAVESDAFVEINGESIRRTVSVGVAAYPEDALNPGDLVQRADEALYRAKRAGKNCVIWA